MHFEESIGQLRNRVRSGGTRKPLRSLAELALEFSITPQHLGKMILKHDGPKPAIEATQNHRGRQSAWYEPKKMRAWWKKISTPEVKS